MDQLQDMYQVALVAMIDEAGGDLGDVIWTSRDGTEAKFRHLSLISIQAMHRYFRIQQQALLSQRDDLKVQADIQKRQKSKRGVDALPIPDGINPGKFKRHIKDLTKRIEDMGFTLYVLETVLKEREKQNLTVSPMLAKMRATATGRFTPKRASA